jgi:hypothetical protein
MRKHVLTILAQLVISQILFSQSVTKQKVFTQDIDNFWIAYDSVRSTTDSLRQIHFIQTLYINNGTPGLKAFMQARDYSAELYVRLIHQYPKFWASIRPNTLLVKSRASGIEKSIKRLKNLYPELENAKIYFTIGGLRSGGTTKDSMVLIGAEIATGNAATDISEFADKWLAGVFKEQQSDNIISLNIHEYIHTQQNGDGSNLLAQAITEGSCDFIAELVSGKPLQRDYITYGREHEQELKEAFKQDMFATAVNKWLYNGKNAKTVADLGYFMGYVISKSYYAHSSDKKLAIKQIIQLNYSDTNAVEAFLKKSEYYTEPINKEQLLQSFQEKQPVFVKLEPFSDEDTTVNASLKEMTLVFSHPMDQGYSISLGKKGKEYFPITGVIGFSDDKKRFTLKIDLKPGHEYEFIITNRSFRSVEGYSLAKDYPVRFKTQ